MFVNFTRVVALMIAVFCLSQPSYAQKILGFRSPEKLPSSINSAAEENTPYVSQDGSTLFFVRTFHEGNIGGEESGQDIWYSKKENGKWSAPSNELMTLNNDQNNVIAGITENDSSMYVYYSYGTNVKLNRGIARSERKKGKWTSPERVKIPKLPLNDGHYGYHVNQSESVLFLSIVNDDSRGEEDLYISIKNSKGKWGEPINLGDSINTSGYEMSPFLSKDEKTLFFASSGHEGLGDADIFMSRRLDDSWTNWSKPVNLGAPINSSGFDAYFYIAGDSNGFFASNRGTELCDLYSVTVKIEKPRPEPTPEPTPQESSEFAGLLKAKGQPVQGFLVKLIDSESGHILRIAATDENGNFSFSKLDPERNYKVLLEEEDKNISNDLEVFIIEKETGEIVRTATQEDKKTYLFDTPSEESENISGIIEIGETPMPGTKIKLVDENNNVIDYATTNEKGEFNFERLDPDVKYAVLIEEEDSQLPDNIQVFIVDEKSGKKIDRTSKKDTKTFGFTPSESKTEGDEITGVLQVGETPMAGTRVKLVDESNNVVGYATTDEKGEFNFEKLDPELNYAVLIDEEDSQLPDNIQMFVVDEISGKKDLASKKPDSKTFEIVKEEEVVESVSGVLQAGDNTPLAGKKVKLVDENNNVVGYATTDEQGGFNFKKLNPEINYAVFLEEEDNSSLPEDVQMFMVDEKSGEKTKSVSKTEDGSFGLEIQNIDAKKEESVAGVIQSGDSIISGARVKLVDEDNNVVGYATTDEQGQFNFTRLDPERNYAVYLDEEDNSSFPQDVQMFVVDEKSGKKVESVNKAEDGGFSIKKAEPAKEEKTENVAGVIQIGDSAVAGTRVKLVDENNKLVGYAMTDENGEFNFTRLDPERNYAVYLAEEDNSSFKDVQMFMVDNKGEKETVEKADDGSFAIKAKAPKAEAEPLPSPKPQEKVSGVIQAGDSALAGTRVKLVDENNKVVGYAVTDEKGQFNFERLDPERNYAVYLAEEDNSSFKDVQMFMVDEAGEKVESAKMKDDGALSFKPSEVILEKKKTSPAKDLVSSETAEGSESKAEKQEESDVVIISASEAAKLKDPQRTTIYFKFNSIHINGPDQRILNRLSRSLNRDKDLVIYVNGHTDNLGTDAINKEVSENRAIEVKKYLVTMGVDPDRLIIQVFADQYPIASNDNWVGRAKNRRVEIVYGHQ